MKELIERLRHFAKFYTNDHTGELLDEAADALERYQWRSVSEGLPERGKKYLVAGINPDSGYRWTGTCKFIGSDDSPLWEDEMTDAYNDYLEWTHEVTHWMPLPEPPKD